MTRCYDPFNGWCPGGSLLSRARANGTPFSRELANDHRKTAAALNVVACRAHNDEIARAMSRGFVPLRAKVPPSKIPELRAARVALERDEKRRGSLWEKLFMSSGVLPGGGLPGSAGDSKSPAVGSTPTTFAMPERVVCKAGDDGLPVEYTRVEEFSTLPEAYDTYQKVRARSTFVKLLGLPSGYAVKYGWSGRPVRRLNWRQISIPKEYRTKPRKRR